jgi:hypothetical protein
MKHAMVTARRARRSAAVRFGPAVIGLFALLIQALLPAAALAGQRPAGGETIVICTQMGVQTLTVGDQPAEGFAGLPCIDCLAVSMATAPPPEISVAPVDYLVQTVERAPPTADLALRAARAPPRPPGQGPPLPNA